MFGCEVRSSRPRNKQQVLDFSMLSYIGMYLILDTSWLGYGTVYREVPSSNPGLLHHWKSQVGPPHTSQCCMGSKRSLFVRINV